MVSISVLDSVLYPWAKHFTSCCCRVVRWQRRVMLLQWTGILARWVGNIYAMEYEKPSSWVYGSFFSPFLWWPRLFNGSVYLAVHHHHNHDDDDDDNDHHHNHHHLLLLLFPCYLFVVCCSILFRESWVCLFLSPTNDFSCLGYHNNNNSKAGDHTPAKNSSQVSLKSHFISLQKYIPVSIWAPEGPHRISESPCK